MICLYMLNEYTSLNYHHGIFYIHKSNYRHKVVSVNQNLFSRFLQYPRLTTRLLRLEPRCAERLNRDCFVISYAHKIWLLNITTKCLSELQRPRIGFSTPLNMVLCNDFVYWGDYGNNKKREAVNIYRLDSSLAIEIVYTFPKKSIRHIHNIIKTNDGFIVLAGDNEKDAGIYKANTDWTDVIPWKIGKQRYRAVIGFMHVKGFIYATDSVETENHIRIIADDGTESVIAAINGSCIYGVETEGYYIFSTTVEPREKGLLWDNRLGKGIKNHNVEIIAVSKIDFNTRIVRTFKKDFWPMKLFQYGACIFPKNQTTNNKLTYNIIACKGDGKIDSVEL